MTTATKAAAHRSNSTDRRSIREVCVLRRDADSDAPQPGDAVRVEGRLYLVLSGSDGLAEPDRGGYVLVREIAVTGRAL